MKKLLLIIIVLSLNFTKAQNPVTGLDDPTDNFWTVTYLLDTNNTRTNSLAYPFEIIYGPDGWLWITERGADGGVLGNNGERIIRIKPADGTKIEMLSLSSEVAHSTSSGSASAQDGLLGMAIHPDLYGDLNASNNYVFVAYTYNNGGRKAKIVRLLYDPLGSPNQLTFDTSLNGDGTVIDGLPASNDHNSGRLKIGPDLKLYYTIGDQGSNQFGNRCNPILSQVLPSQAEVDAKDYSNYPGKLLRLDLDGGIPIDNPTFDHDIDGGVTPEVLSHIYTYGHRNHQGLVFAVDGTLYNAEHGAKVDDEINKIIAGGNYGWPQIAGYYDNLSYSYCNWSSAGGSCSSQSFSDHNCHTAVTPIPEFTSGMPSDFKPPIGTYGSTVSTNPTGDWLTWPTVAPSSIDIYEGGLIPNWGKSLLITTLKEGTIFRAKLTAGGNDIDDIDGIDVVNGDDYEEFHSSIDRYRDLAFDPDGVTIYAITDTGGTTSGPSGSSSAGAVHHPGDIVVIKYTGATLSINDDALVAFQLYPNPSNIGEVGLKVSNEILEFNVSILNILGQKMRSDSFKNIGNANFKISTKGLKSGVYFVAIKTNSGKAVKKLVIE